MRLMRSARHFMRRVKADGIRCVPKLCYARWMTLRHRDVLRQEQTARMREEARYQAWILARERMEDAPLVTTLRLSFLIPTCNTPAKLLRALADSLLRQTCPRWEACFYDGGSTRAETRSMLRALAEEDSRFHVTLGEENLGIAGNTNRALAMATGDVVALCDHDDLLSPHATYRVLEAAQSGADFIYTDEDKVSADGTRYFDPHLKPDFAPDSFRAGNYICHLMAMRRSLMNAVGGLRPSFDGSQDHDLALRATEQAERIVHIPVVLYHWRMLDTSFSHARAEQCALAACRATQEQLNRLNLPGKATVEALRTRIYDTVPPSRVTALVWGTGQGPKGVAEVLRVTDGRWNALAAQAQGDYLLFYHAGLRPLDKDWVNELLMYAARKDVGCVGSAILNAERFYLHAGYAVDTPLGAVSHQRGAWQFGAPYHLTDREVRNVTGLSGALLMVKKEVFLKLGGFSDYASDLRGADFGLKCLQAGFLNVYTPHARMVCPRKMEPPCLTGAAPAEDLRRFQAAWGAHPPERYMSPLMARDGSMTVDFGGTDGQGQGTL